MLLNFVYEIKFIFFYNEKVVLRCRTEQKIISTDLVFRLSGAWIIGFYCSLFMKYKLVKTGKCLVLLLFMREWNNESGRVEQWLFPHLGSHSPSLKNSDFIFKQNRTGHIGILITKIF